MCVGPYRQVRRSVGLFGAVVVLAGSLMAACQCDSTGTRIERIVVDPPDSCFHAVPASHAGPICSVPVVAFRNDCDHSLSVAGSDLAPGNSGELAVGIPCSGVTDCPVEVDWTITGSNVDVLIALVGGADAGTPDGDAGPPSP